MDDIDLWSSMGERKSWWPKKSFPATIIDNWGGFQLLHSDWASTGGITGGVVGGSGGEE